MKPTPCIACHKTFETGLAELPLGGIIFSALGNYGSRLFDPPNIDGHEQLYVIICDQCVEEAANRGEVLLANITRQSSLVDYQPFNPGEWRT